MLEPISGEWSVFDRESGLILCSVRGPESTAMLTSTSYRDAGYVAGGGDRLKDWVKGGVVCRRHPLPVIVDGMVVRGIPSGALVIVGDMDAVMVNDGEVALDLADADEPVSVVIRCDPYQPWEHTFAAGG